MSIFSKFKQIFTKSNKIESKDEFKFDLKTGDVFDFDDHTWKVISEMKYEYGGGEIEKCWKIISGYQEGFLSYDGEEIYFFVKDDFQKVWPPLIKYLKEHTDLPEEIKFENDAYTLIYSTAGYYYGPDRGEKVPVIVWLYENSKDKFNLLEIQQWGEEDFEVLIGRKVEEWEIENILSKTD